MKLNHSFVFFVKDRPGLGASRHMKKHLSLQLNSRPIRPGFCSALQWTVFRSANTKIIRLNPTLFLVTFEIRSLTATGYRGFSTVGDELTRCLMLGVKCMYMVLQRTAQKYIFSFHNTDSPQCITRTRFYHLYKRGRVMIFQAKVKGRVSKFHSHCRDGSPHFRTQMSFASNN